jgi:hypothetical protein
LDEKERQIPGSVQYMIRRYEKNPRWSLEDTGMMVYHYQRENPQENYFELRFCISGNAYCSQKEKDCNTCRLHTSRLCPDRVETVDVMSFRFSSVHLSQFVKPQQRWAVCRIMFYTSNILLHFQNIVTLQPHTHGTGRYAEPQLY